MREGETDVDSGSMSRRRWRWDGRPWTASVDRLMGKCGDCRPGRWLHIDAPDGERYTFPMAAGARLDEIDPAELVALVRRQADDG